MSVFESGYSTSDTLSVSGYSNCMFMISMSNRILSDMLTLFIFEYESKKKYENKVILVIYVHIRYVYISIVGRVQQRSQD